MRIECLVWVGGEDNDKPRAEGSRTTWALDQGRSANKSGHNQKRRKREGMKGRANRPKYDWLKKFSYPLIYYAGLMYSFIFEINSLSWLRMWPPETLIDRLDTGEHNDPSQGKAKQIIVWSIDPPVVPVKLTTVGVRYKVRGNLLSPVAGHEPKGEGETQCKSPISSQSCLPPTHHMTHQKVIVTWPIMSYTPHIHTHVLTRRQ